MNRHFQFKIAVLLVLIAVPGCSKPEVAQPAVSPGPNEDDRAIANLIKSEDLILDLTPRLSRLAKWFEENSVEPKAELQGDLASCREIRGLANADPDSVFNHDPGR